jgi:hypothetical protein
LPFIYDKYEDIIDDHAKRISEQAQAYYKKLDENVFSKIPRAPVKEKKSVSSINSYHWAKPLRQRFLCFFA